MYQPAPELTMLRTPDRATDAHTAAMPASSSPTASADDDTLSETSFDAGSDHFAFTPKRPSKVLRAWERKPATPFAPRTETQKIWKRVPLQDKPTNGTVEIRTNGKHDGDARGVKRTRLAGPTTGNGKENYANTQWDKQADDARRKLPKEQTNVLRSPKMAPSPLKKECTFDIVNDPPPATALELEADRVVRRLEEMQKADEAAENELRDDGLQKMKSLKAELVHSTPPTHKSDNTMAELAYDSEEATSEDGAANTPSTNGFFTDSIIFDDQESESEIDEAPAAGDVTYHAHDSDCGSETSYEQPPSTLPATNVSLILSTEDDKSADVLQGDCRPPLINSEQHNLQVQVTGMETETAASVQLSSNRTIESTEETKFELCGCEINPDHGKTAETVKEDLERHTESSSSLQEQEGSGPNVLATDSNNGEAETPSTSETSLPQTCAVSHAMTGLQVDPDQILNNASSTNTAQSDVMIFGGANDNLCKQLFTPQAPVLPAPEAPPSDDTAYLHDFLTRARAQKAARAASSPERIGSSVSSPAKNTRQAQSNLVTDSTSPLGVTHVELRPDEVVEDTINDDQATSPCRRSSRPRLPKPLKSVVPSIPNTIPVRRSNGTEFVFLQRTEAMQISLDTRTNTLRNKGEAVPPSMRLGSLVTGEMSPIKERKKNSKAKKTVKWDEKLGQEQLEALLEDQALVMDTQSKSKPEPLAKTEEKTISEVEKSEKREKNARKSVKRLGTVNGTPAPKKRVMPATALPVPTRTLRARTKT
jgi:hypothetical protein